MLSRCGFKVGFEDLSSLILLYFKFYKLILIKYELFIDFRQQYNIRRIVNLFILHGSEDDK